MSTSRRRRRPPPATTDQRTPDERLEALVREPNPDRMERTLQRILLDLDAAPEPGPWIAAARLLSERLIIGENTFYYFAELFSECLVLHAAESDAELLRIHDEMEAIELAHGLRAGAHWNPGKIPADWQALDDEWNDRADDIVVQALRELGHADVADLREQKPSEYETRVEDGRVRLWGEDEEDEVDESPSPIY